MSIRTTLQYGATALVSCATGWLMNASDAQPVVAPDRPGVQLRAVAPAAPDGSSPVIAVSTDGNVTLRVEQQPLEWVLEQIAQQAGPAGNAHCTPAPTAPSTRGARVPAPTRVATVQAVRAPDSEIATVTPERAAQLLQKIERGAEGERYAALLEARADGVTLPDELLKSLFENDASERLSTLALETYLEPLADSAEAMHAALREALYVSNPATRREAQRLLDELLESERSEAANAE